MAPLFFSRCVWQRIISLKLQFDWECDDKPVDLAVYSILGQTHAIQTAINKNACPTYLPIIHWLLCIHIQYITLFIPKISHGFLHPPFFYFIHMKKHMPIPAPHGSVLDLFKSCGHAEACASWGSRWQSLVLFLSSRPVGDDASGWRVFSPQELVFNIV